MITSAMVETAAKAIYPGGHHDRCQGFDDCSCYFRQFTIQARRALEATLPELIAERDELRAKVDILTVHSQRLNTLSWSLACTLGFTADAQQIAGSPEEFSDLVIEDRAALRRKLARVEDVLIDPTVHAPRIRERICDALKDRP